HPHLRARRDARRDAHGDLVVLHDAARAVARGALRAAGPPGAVAARAAARDARAERDGAAEHRLLEGNGERQRGVVVVVALRAALRVLQYLVRRGDVLEPLLRRRVTGIHVRVVLAREPAIRLLDVGFARRLRDAEDFVRILGHGANDTS